MDFIGHKADDIGAILIDGKSINKILIKNNIIHDYNGLQEGAHGIAVYGRGGSETDVIKNIIISGNTIRDMKTYWSESLVVNGNVKNWEIKYNIISNVNNIAIDAIGGEGTSPKQKENGKFIPGNLDAARYGFIEYNAISGMNVCNNLAYHPEGSPSALNMCGNAAGIYVDGGRFIHIEGNILNNNALGIEIGAENCIKTSHITIINNNSSNSNKRDVLMGGYAVGGFLENSSINCDPDNTIDANEGHGYVEYVTIKNNDFTTIPDNPENDNENIKINNRFRHAIILGEGLIDINTNNGGNASGDENAVITSE